jgi:hypothetical protein
VIVGGWKWNVDLQSAEKGGAVGDVPSLRFGGRTKCVRPYVVLLRP